MPHPYAWVQPAAEALRSPPRAHAALSHDGAQWAATRSTAPFYYPPVPDVKGPSTSLRTKEKREVYFAPPRAPTIAVTGPLRKTQTTNPPHEGNVDLHRHVTELEGKVDQLMHVLHERRSPSPIHIAGSQLTYFPPPVVPLPQRVELVVGSPSVSMYYAHPAPHPVRWQPPPPPTTPDPATIAASLYAPYSQLMSHPMTSQQQTFYELVPTNSPHYETKRLSPPRHRAAAAMSNTTGGFVPIAAPPPPVARVPPPPVLPSYVPARDRIDAVEHYYADLALRNLMQDIEDAERVERIRISEEQLITVRVLEERHRALGALRVEEAKLERLAALDAEAMLRAHMSKVQRGAFHRDQVLHDIVTTVAERERSPDGRRARVLLETSRSPVRTRLQSDASLSAPAQSGGDAAWSTSQASATRMAKHATPAVASPVLPGSASPFVTPMPGEGSLSHRRVSTITSQPPKGDEGDFNSSAYASARRRYKKMLMEQALR